MLQLTKKFFDQTNYLEQGYEVCFNPIKNKLTFCKPEKANKNITDLQEIIKHVNQLEKPTFTQIIPFCNLYRKIEAINESIASGIATTIHFSIDLEDFNKSLKPKTSDLKEHFLEAEVLPESVFKSLKKELQTELTSLLDKWIAEDPQEANRITAKNEILDIFNTEKTFLNLNNLKLSSLPDVFDMGNLQKIQVLDLSENQLKTLPKSIGKLLSVNSLNLAGNRLETVPEVIKELSALKELDLEDNHLEAWPEDVNLPLLKKLNLSYNQFTSLSDGIGKLLSIKSLNLAINRLETVPEVLKGLSSLKKLNLEGNEILILPEFMSNLRSLKKLNMACNSISGIPMQLLDLPGTCTIDLTECPLSAVILERLRQITNDPDYAGPRISFSIVDRMRGEEKSIQESLKELYCIVGKSPVEFSNLAETTELRSWLHRLSDIADYEKGGELQKIFSNKIIEYLNQANEDQKFREIFYSVIQDAAETCGDRMALSVLHLGIAHQLAIIDLKDMKRLADFLKGVWAINMLEDIARNKVSTLPFFDEIEVYLGYPIKLKEELNLPIDVQDMLYFACSALKPEDLQEAKAFVLSKQQNQEAYFEFLISDDKWKEALSVNYTEEYKAIWDQREEASELENPNYTAIEQNFHEQLKRLTKRALAKRALSDNGLHEPKRARGSTLNKEDELIVNFILNDLPTEDLMNILNDLPGEDLIAILRN